jgi:hypothetical protein
MKLLNTTTGVIIISDLPNVQGGSGLVIPPGVLTTIYNEDAEKSQQLGSLLASGALSNVGPDEPSSGQPQAATQPGFVSPAQVFVNGTPSSGKVLTGIDASHADWQTPTGGGGGSPTGSAGGDLGGSYPNPSVAKVNGVAVAGTPTSGQVITATNATHATWQTPSGGGGTPGGSNTMVQFNDSGAFGGDGSLLWDKTSNRLGVGAPGTAASVAIEDILYTAKDAGTPGNSISIRYIAGATAGSEIVSAITNAISVQIQDGVSTATQVMNAISASPSASALVSTVSGGGLAGLVGYYGLNEVSGSVAADSVGSNPGTNSSHVAGKVGNGTAGTYPLFVATQDLSAPSWSILAWFNGSGGAIQIGNGPGDYLDVEVNTRDAGSNQPNWLYVENDFVNILADVSVPGISTGWHLLGITFDGSYRFYIDGVLVAGPVAPAAVISGPQSVGVGGLITSWSGVVDEIGITNTVVSAIDQVGIFNFGGAYAGGNPTNPQTVAPASSPVFLTGGTSGTLDASLQVTGDFKLADGSQGAGKFLTSDAAGLASWATLASAGSNKEVIFNNSGAFSSDPAFQFDSSTSTLSVSGTGGHILVSAPNDARPQLTVQQSSGSGGAAIDLRANNNGLSRTWRLGTDLEHVGDFHISSSSSTGGTPNTLAIKILTNGNVGIGDGTPSAKLQVDGTFKLLDGSQGAGKVLTSDASGLASWQTPSGGGSPGGSNNQFQFNNAGSFDGSNFLTINVGGQHVQIDNGSQQNKMYAWGSQISYNGGLKSFATAGNVIGGTGSDDLCVDSQLGNVYLATQELARLTVDNAGNIGFAGAVDNLYWNSAGSSLAIGVDPVLDPADIGGYASLHISKDSGGPLINQALIILDTYGSNGSGIIFRRANGTKGAPTATMDGDSLMFISDRGHDGTNWTTSLARMAAYATENWTPTATGDKLSFFTNPNGTTGTVENMTLDGNGNLTVTGTVNGMTVPGANWVTRTTLDSQFWRGITYGNGVFVAVSSTGPNRTATSVDGINWTQSAAVSGTWVDVAYGNGLFIAVATNSQTMLSTDGYNWTAGLTPSGNTDIAITYGNGLFVATAQTGIGNRVMTTVDGTSWTFPSYPEDNSWRDIAYGNGTFVAVAITGTNRVMTSPDGSTWSAVSVSAANWRGVAYGNGTFVAIANNNFPNMVMTSPDGVTWTNRAVPIAAAWNDVTYGDGLFVAIAGNNSGNQAMTSPDGINWTVRTTPASPAGYIAIAYGGGMFAAVASAGASSRLITSGAVLDITNHEGNTFLGKFKFADGSQGAGKILTSDANGKASWQGGGGSVTGSGTTGKLVAWASGSTIGDASDFDVSGNSITRPFGGEVSIGGSGATLPSGSGTIVAGGSLLTVTGNSDSGIVAGRANQILSGPNGNNKRCFIGGGMGNLCDGDTNGGGGQNGIIAGNNNHVGHALNSGGSSVIIGGDSNTITGPSSAIFAGTSCVVAGQSSAAAGIQAQANHDFSFVWCDGSGSLPYATSATNQFRVRASGGIFLDSPVSVAEGFRIAEGANARMGVATLVGGTVTVSNTSVTANTRIMLTIQDPNGGTPGSVYVSARAASTSFTITSTSGADTSIVAWVLVEPA